MGLAPECDRAALPLAARRLALCIATEWEASHVFQGSRRTQRFVQHANFSHSPLLHNASPRVTSRSLHRVLRGLRLGLGTEGALASGFASWAIERQEDAWPLHCELPAFPIGVHAFARAWVARLWRWALFSSDC